MRNRILATLVVAALGCGYESQMAIDAADGSSPGGQSVTDSTPNTSAQASIAGSAATPPRELTAGAATSTAPMASPAIAGGAAAAPAGAPMTATAGDVPPTAPASAPATMPGAPITPECRGFAFEGLLYSPGGEVLPNKCAPFHPTLNNPYAVRCVDAWPWFSTNYMGGACHLACRSGC